jgi:glycosyltransferase involved in cell wall biosynthesis
LGDGASKANYIERTKKLNNVIFLPRVEREEVPSFLGLCDLLYFAALKSKIWDYGWSPNKLIDYMMAGKPVLASYSGYKSMINEANSGFFVEAENSTEIILALKNIIQKPVEELQEMGEKGKSWLEKNRSWDVIADQYIDLMVKLSKKK